MTKKQNKMVIRFLSVVAVALMAMSIFTITVYKRALDGDLYKEALSQSQIYVIVANIIERNIAESLVAWEKDLVNNLMPQETVSNIPFANEALSFVLDTVIEKQTPELVSNLIGKIGLAETFQNITEKKIEADLQWLKGEKEAHEAFGYIPTPEQIKNVKDSDFTTILDDVVKNALGVNKLPICKSNAEANKNIALIAAGKARDVACTSEQIDVLLLEEFDNSGIKTAVNRIGDGADTLVENSSVNALLDDIYNVSYTIAQIKQIAVNVRADIQSTLKWAYFMLFTSIILGGVVMYLQNVGTRMKIFITMIFSTGFLISVVALLHYVLFSRLLLNAIPFEDVVLGTNLLTSAEVTLLTNSIKFIIEYIVTRIVSLSLVIGVWMMVLSGLIYSIMKLYENRALIQKKINNMINKK